MRYKQFIFLICCSQFEAKLIVHSSWSLSLYVSFLINYIFSLPFPSLLNTFYIFIFNHRIYCRRHPIIIERVCLGKVYYIKTILFIWDHILHWKIKPLIISRRVNIVWHCQIILELIYLDYYKFTFKAANKLPL